MKQPFRVGILGATGAVGQKFIELLARHPSFRVSHVVASGRSAGKTYGEAASWIGAGKLPDGVKDLTVQTPDKRADCDFVFSGLDSAVAGEIEADFASRGIPVISNARNFRMQSSVPLMIPEVNPDHAELVKTQSWPKGGFIATNPNCSTVGLVSAVKPLHDAFGLRALHVTTMQAVSGAGYPGVSALDIAGNVLPLIEGEEQKVESEPRKLLGAISGGEVIPLDVPISAQCNRVPVVDGHLLSISVGLGTPVAPEDVALAFERFEPAPDVRALHFSPDRFIRYWPDGNHPQPTRHALLGRGMTVSVGRLKRCPILDYRFVALVHNTIRGAAGGAILNAELLVERGFLRSRNAGG